MSFSKVSQRSIIAVAILSLLFIVSCEKDDSKKDDPKKTETVADSTVKKSKVDTKDSVYAETVADYEWKEELKQENFRSFKINFIAEEDIGKTYNGQPMKNHPIESHYAVFFEDLKLVKGYNDSPIKRES